MLTGKRIVLGVTGGIAAYKACELVRLLVKAGCEVHVVMTRNATEFVTPLTFQSLSGNPVHTQLFDLWQEKEIGHIALADRADLVVVAPATANLIGKVAGGLADDLLSTTLMATKAPVLFAPAMNVNMWENPLYRANQARLEQLGYHFIEPATGLLACGWEGKGKLPDPEILLAHVRRLLAPGDFRGETVLVTAGPTREPLDPVRYISNYSSGKMGYAVARAAWERGARVLLVSGPTGLTPPEGVKCRQVTTAREMCEQVLADLPEATIVIKTAAVADYRPEEVRPSKVKRRGGPPPVTLVENPDILAEVGARKEGRTLVGFAAETEDLLENARSKLTGKNLDLIVANDVTRAGAGFDVDTNIVKLLKRDGSVEDWPVMSKELVAHRLLDVVRSLRSGAAGAL